MARIITRHLNPGCFCLKSVISGKHLFSRDITVLSGYSRGSREITAQSGNYGAVRIFKGLSGIFASGQSGYSGVVNL